MKSFFIAFSIFEFTFFNLEAADNYPIGARSAGVANASVTYCDIWSAVHNQAGLTQVKSVAAGVFFENPYFLPGLSTTGFILVIPTPRSGIFAFSTTLFGGSLYNEKKAGLAYSKKLGQKISAGIQLDYLSTYIADQYGSTSLFTYEIGLLAEPVRKLKIGFHLFNPNKNELSVYVQEHIPVIMRLGLSYRFSGKVLVSTETEKDIAYPSIFKTGIEYQIAEALDLRAGVSTNPSVNTFGFGLKIQPHCRMDIATRWHQPLGFSLQFSMEYEFH
jgi:hypothetical protein